MRAKNISLYPAAHRGGVKLASPPPQRGCGDEMIFAPFSRPNISPDRLYVKGVYKKREGWLGDHHPSPGADASHEGNDIQRLFCDYEIRERDC